MKREEIYNNNVDKIYNLLKKMVNSHEDAKDLTHDVFVKFFNSQQKFMHLSSVSTYIYRIAINIAINFNNKNKMIKNKGIFSANTNEIITPSTNKNAVDKIAEDEFADLLKQKLEQLPPNQAKAFYLSKIEDLNNKQIADILNVSISAVESLVHRAKKKLAKIFLENMSKKKNYVVSK